MSTQSEIYDFEREEETTNQTESCGADGTAGGDIVHVVTEGGDVLEIHGVADHSSITATSEATDIEARIERSEAPWQDPEILEALYWDRGLTFVEVGEILGCSERSVGRWLQRTGVGTRNISEAIQQSEKV